MRLPGCEPRAMRRAKSGPPPETYEQYIRSIRDDVRERPHYRPRRNLAPPQYGAPRQNPWHENLDNTMFYL